MHASKCIVGKGNDKNQVTINIQIQVVNDDTDGRITCGNEDAFFRMFFMAAERIVTSSGVSCGNFVLLIYIRFRHFFFLSLILQYSNLMHALRVSLSKGCKTNQKFTISPAHRDNCFYEVSIIFFLVSLYFVTFISYSYLTSYSYPYAPLMKKLDLITLFLNSLSSYLLYGSYLLNNWHYPWANYLPIKTDLHPFIVHYILQIHII